MKANRPPRTQFYRPEVRRDLVAEIRAAHPEFAPWSDNAVIEAMLRIAHKDNAEYDLLNEISDLRTTAQQREEAGKAGKNKSGVKGKWNERTDLPKLG